MQILGSKGGSINPIGDAKLTQRNGVSTNLTHEVSKTELLRAMEKLSKGESIEEKQEQEKKRLERRSKVDKAYQEWLNHDHVSEYKNHIPTNPNHSIIKVFYYNEQPTSTSLIIETTTDDPGYHRVYPIAKVVAVSQYDTDIRTFGVGDLVSIPAVMCKTIQSREWMEYQKMVREQPTLKDEFPEPPAYIGKLSDWTQYIYAKDPFSDADIDDQHTFCLRDSLLQTKLSK